jgi:hypothetical protein
MGLKKELKIHTIVLLAKRPAEFKASDFNQYWLDVNKIIPASSINKLSIFSPLVVQALSEKLNLVVTQDQIQVAPTAPEIFKEIATTNCIALVKEMEAVELSGMGLNFNWYLHDDNIGYEEISSKFFLGDRNPASKYFNDGNQMFGSYLSKDIDSDFRLKLDIKPVTLFDVIEGKNFNTIQCAFNFHSDLKVEKQKDKIIELLSNYDKWFKITEEIMSLCN